MAEARGPFGPQFHADRPQEQEAVRTTIVGGRPPGSGQPLGSVPRGIEVLVKKASIDPAFREALLSRRAAAADEIGLRLDNVEAMMLTAAPREQLETVIASATVPEEHRRAFLGHVAAAMLAAIGVATAGCGESVRLPTKGIRPDRPIKPAEKPPEENAKPEAGAAGAAPGDQRKASAYQEGRLIAGMTKDPRYRCEGGDRSDESPKE
jgi:hypothetical protein